MKLFSLPIPSGWRNPKKLPIPTHAELVERVAVLMERVARQDVRLRRLTRWHCQVTGDPPVNETGNRNSFLDPNLGRSWQESEDFVPDSKGYTIPRSVVFHPTKEDLVDLEHWCNANGECWWHPARGPSNWRLVNPTIAQSGWLLPHYAIPVIPAPEGGQR